MAAIEPIVPVELEKTHRRRIANFHALVFGNQPQRVIDVRQMVQGHVPHERAFDGRIAQAPMQPVQKDAKLREQSERNYQPVWIHTSLMQICRCGLLWERDLRDDRNMSITEAQVRNIFSGLAAGEPDKFFAYVDDHVKWRVMGTHPMAGEYKSKKEFREATLEKLGKLFPEGLRLYTRDVFVSGDRAAVELYANATSNDGVRFNNEYCWVCRFEGERIVEVRAYLDSALVQKLIDASRNNAAGR
jgi:ketosteroid isomerase-like protein